MQQRGGCNPRKWQNGTGDRWDRCSFFRRRRLEDPSSPTARKTTAPRLDPSKKNARERNGVGLPRTDDIEKAQRPHGGGAAEEEAANFFLRRSVLFLKTIDLVITRRKQRTVGFACVLLRVNFFVWVGDRGGGNSTVPATRFFLLVASSSAEEYGAV